MKMVRNSMLAIAAGVLISPALLAADIDSQTGTWTVASELVDAASATDQIYSQNVRVILGAEYTADDIITLTFNVDAVDTDALPTSVVAAGDATSAGVTLGLLSATAGEAIYRVTELDTTAGGTSTVGQVIDFGSIYFDADQLVGQASVTVGYTAQTDSGFPLDNAGGDLNSAELFDIDSAFTVAVLQAFNGIIDVNQDRLAFENPEFGPGGDIASFQHTNSYPSWGVGTISYDVTVTGDFSWVYDGDPDTAGIQDVNGVVFNSCGSPFRLSESCA